MGRHILACLLTLGWCAPLHATLFDQGSANGPDAAAAAQGWAIAARGDEPAAGVLNPASLWGSQSFALQTEYASLLGGKQIESDLFHRGNLSDLGLGYGLAYRRVDDSAVASSQQQWSLALGLPFSQDQSLCLGAAFKWQELSYNRSPLARTLVGSAAEPGWCLHQPFERPVGWGRFARHLARRQPAWRGMGA